MLFINAEIDWYPNFSDGIGCQATGHGVFLLFLLNFITNFVGPTHHKLYSHPGQDLGCESEYYLKEMEEIVALQHENIHLISEPLIYEANMVWGRDVVSDISSSQ